VIQTLARGPHADSFSAAREHFVRAAHFTKS